MATASDRWQAHGWLSAGSVHVALSAGNILRGPTGWVSGPGRLLLMVGIFVLGALLCSRGVTLLRTAKKAAPDQSWLWFLRTELTMVVVVNVCVVGSMLLPQPVRDAVDDAMRQL